MISTYLSPDEGDGGIGGEKQYAQAGTSSPAWYVPTQRWEVRGKSCEPYFADCPYDKVKSLEALGDVLSGPSANQNADSRGKSGGAQIYTHASLQGCFD